MLHNILGVVAVDFKIVFSNGSVGIENDIDVWAITSDIIR
jgi:hypothetical protein